MRAAAPNLTQGSSHPPFRRSLDLCAPIGFVYLDKFLELLTHSIQEVRDDTCARGKGIICRHHRTFWGSGTPCPPLPWVAVLSASPPRLTSPLRPTPADRRTLPGLAIQRTRIPAPSPGRNAAKEAVLETPTDRPTDGRRPMAGQGEPARARGVSVPTRCTPSPAGSRDLLDRSLSGLLIQGGADPGEGNRCARLTARLGNLLSKLFPKETNPVKGASEHLQLQDSPRLWLLPQQKFLMGGWHCV